MSEVKHTAEPWTIGTYTNYSGAAIHAPDGSCVLERWEGLDGKPVATERAERMRADAARAIACVNALAGIPNPAGFVKSHADLLEALEDALQYLQHHLPEEMLAPHRAAIAKAKGKQ